KMPDMDGIECAKRIRSNETKLKIIVLTQFGDKGLIEKLRKFDVDGYLLKKSSKEEIVQAIQTVQKNEKYYSEEIKAKISNSRDRASRFDYLKCKFSKREEQVLELICKGKTNQQIAEELNLSINSITTYRQRIMIKTGMSNAAELVMWATENDMVDRSKVIDF
ncbi:MAG: response regulator transcription factor, partial [Bacteroidales bacterium]